MALNKSSLTDALANIFDSKPSSSVEAGLQWAQAYYSYASGAMTSVASLPVNAPAGLPILIGAFSTALTIKQPQASAAAMAGGVMLFWQVIAWAGPTASGATAVPGNFALIPALAGIFADAGGGGNRDKAGKLADAFDAGAKLVIAAEFHLVTGVPLVGPIQ